MKPSGRPLLLLFAAVLPLRAAAADPAPPSPAAREPAPGAAEAARVLSGVERNVQANWNRIGRASDRIAELREELPSLPDRAWFSTDKRDQRERIRDKIGEARELLLSTTAKELLRDLSRVEDRIASCRAEITSLRDRMVVSPERRERLQKAIDEQEKRIAALEETRAGLRARIVAELEALGLRMDDATAELFLSNVCAETLIDNTVVARNIAAVVEKLRELMEGGDIASARRYFGMYLVLVDIQQECFRIYLEKHEKEWLPGIDAILAEAEQTLADSRHHAASGEYAPEQREIFRRNAELNRQTLDAARAYRRVLEQQAAAVREKDARAARIHAVAENSFRTISLAGAFLDLVRSNGADFDAILRMELPTLSSFDDTGLRQEFLQITRKIRERE